MRPVLAAAIGANKACAPLLPIFSPTQVNSIKLFHKVASLPALASVTTASTKIRHRPTGIWVANTPGVLDNAVAEHAVWMIGALARQVHHAHGTTAAGDWKPATGIEVRGRKITILGCGRIGRNLSAKLHHGMGMHVTGYDIMEDPTFTAEDGIDHYTTSLDDALADADFVLTLLPVSGLHQAHRQLRVL